MTGEYNTFPQEVSELRIRKQGEESKIRVNTDELVC